MVSYFSRLSFVCLVVGAVGQDDSWRQVYKAGYNDSAGRYAGGSETIHLEGHAEKLYSAIGYWEDTRNCVYASKVACYSPKASKIGWAQVLRLDAPNATWQVDLELGRGYLRAESLKSLTFTTDGAGKPLKSPVTKLVVGAYRTWAGDAAASIWIRDDATGKWKQSDIVSNNAGSIRTLRMHRDSVTGADQAFITVGTLGIYSGVWDESLGSIAWSKASESGKVGVRPLAQAEANNDLFFSSGQYLYRRTDGPSPSWKVVHDFGNTPNPAIGGIRGLTAIPTPTAALSTPAASADMPSQVDVADTVGSRASSPANMQSLLLIWTNSSSNQGRTVRTKVLTMHCTHYALHSLCTALTMHCTHFALHSLFTALTIHCTHYALYSLQVVCIGWTLTAVAVLLQYYYYSTTSS
jgi:hypothetical protein